LLHRDNLRFHFILQNELAQAIIEEHSTQ